MLGGSMTVEILLISKRVIAMAGCAFERWIVLFVMFAMVHVSIANELAI